MKTGNYGKAFSGKGRSVEIRLIALITLFLAVVLPGHVALICQTPDPPGSKSDFGWSLKRNIKPRRSPIARQQHREVSSLDSDDGLIRVDTDLVVNDFLVFDKRGDPVQNLTRNDFTLSEDKDPQQIALFSNDGSAIPRLIILIIDHSYSQLPFISTSIDAARVLVDKLKPNDQMAIVSDDVKLIAERTSDKGLLIERLEALKTLTLNGNPGESKQYSSLMAVLKEMFDVENTRPIVIFQTDGDQLSLLVTCNSYSGIGHETFSYDDVLKTAKRQRVTIYTVFSGVAYSRLSKEQKLSRIQEELKENERVTASIMGTAFVSPKTKYDARYFSRVVEAREREESAVANIATSTGGMAQSLETPDRASEIYDRILSDINRRYEIGYYPSNQARNGKRREISIEVRGHPEYTVWGRKSYFAPTTSISEH